MDLTASIVADRAAEYERVEPLHAVEQDNVETFPAAFRDGSLTWKDAEWIVWWYYRRYLGAFPDDERRAVEDAFRENDFETVQDAVGTMLEADDVAGRVRSLTTLRGVDVPIASAFLFYGFPETYPVVGEREWGVLRAAGEIEAAYPDPPSVAEYGSYAGTYREVADRCSADLPTLYRAIWRLGAE
jgi:hypothetical protein